MSITQLDSNKLPVFLKGSNDLRNVVALELIDSTKAKVFIRELDNTIKDKDERLAKSKVKEKEIDWNYWFVVHDKKFADNFLLHVEENPKTKEMEQIFGVEKLHGDKHYKYYVYVIKEGISVTKINEYIVNTFNKTYDTQISSVWDIKNIEEHEKEIIRFTNQEACFMQTGITQFKGMTFSDLKIMVLDIETTHIYEDMGQIFLISVYTNYGFKELIWNNEDDDEKILKRLVKIIQQEDPDILVNHNLYSFDWSYINHRAIKNDVKLSIGRKRGSFYQDLYYSKNSIPLKVGESTEYFKPSYIYGRHSVDTLHLTKRHNSIKRDMENFNLKWLARNYFDLYHGQKDNRTYIEGDEIYKTWLVNKEEVLKYCYEDTWETMKILEQLVPSYFTMASLAPTTFQKICYCGTASIWNMMMVREYLRSQYNKNENKNVRYSLPTPLPKKEFKGGFTGCFVKGMVKDVHKADVGSLYPSIMLTMGVKPESDDLDVFLSMLKAMTDFRLSAKEELKKYKKGSEEYIKIDALQGTMKILINSAYGALGSSTFLFNSPDGAEKVTSNGQQIVKQMMDITEEDGCLIIEIDTDAVIFKPSFSISDVKEYIKDLSDKLPDGINVEYEAHWNKFFSYKTKNYIMQEKRDDGTYKYKIKGAALKASNKPFYITKSMNKMVELIFTDKFKEIKQFYCDMITQIRTRTIPIEDICTKTKYSTSIDSYLNELKEYKKLTGVNKAKQAFMELIIQKKEETGRVNYNYGDKIHYYKMGEKANEGFIIKQNIVIPKQCVKCVGKGCSYCNHVGYTYEYETCHKCLGESVVEKEKEKTIKKIKNSKRTTNKKLSLFKELYKCFKSGNLDDLEKIKQDDILIKGVIEILGLDDYSVISNIEITSIKDVKTDEIYEIDEFDHLNEDEIIIDVLVKGVKGTKCATCGNKKKVKVLLFNEKGEELIETKEFEPVQGKILKKTEHFTLNSRLLEDAPKSCEYCENVGIIDDNVCPYCEGSSSPDYNIKYYEQQFIRTVCEPFKVCFSDEIYNNIFSMEPLKDIPMFTSFSYYNEGIDNENKESSEENEENTVNEE